MSNATYAKFWTDANELHQELMACEKPIDQNLQVKDRATAFQHYAVMYVRYIVLYKKLNTAYDQLLHPQKRRLLKEMLIASIGRLVEVRHILVDLECSDFFNLSEVLLDLKLAHEELKVPVPRFIAEETSAEQEVANKLLATLNVKEFKYGGRNILAPDLSLEDAIRIIQTNERGRQGKVRARYLNDLHAEAKHEKLLQSVNPIPSAEERERAVVLIQKLYKGYTARKEVAKMRHEQSIFLGMASPASIPNTTKNYDRRKGLQKTYETEYLESLVTTKEKILNTEGPDMKEVIQDDFRQWYMEHKRIHGKFPEFPEEKEWKAPDFKFSMSPSVRKDSSSKPQSKEGKSTTSKSSGTTSKPATPKGGKKDAVDEFSTKFKSLADSEFLQMFSDLIQKFDNLWKDKDESENFSQRHDQEIVKNSKRKEVEAQIKEEIFVVLEDELRNLKLTVEKDSQKKGKAVKAKKPKKEKGSKKGKKNQDLTADMSLDSLIEELVQTKIIQKYSPCHFDSWIGNFNLTERLASKAVFIEPSIAEVQKTIVEYCALPLGLASAIEGMQPKYPKVASVLLYGSSGTGKSRLVQSLATEIGATFFNLSPKNTEGEYQSKEDVAKLMNMVIKVAKASSPAIIYIEGVEMIFAKKVPKDDTSDPKRIKKDLIKALKLLKDHSCRVLLVGTSSKPWDAEFNAMMALFDKVLHCPKPDYYSRYTIWRTLIEKKSLHFSRNLNYSILARTSDNLATGIIEMVVEKVISENRLKQQRMLEIEEFLVIIREIPPIWRSIEEKTLFTEFNAKISSKREALLQAPSEEESAKNAKKRK